MEEKREKPMQKGHAKDRGKGLGLEKGETPNPLLRTLVWVPYPSCVVLGTNSVRWTCRGNRISLIGSSHEDLAVFRPSWVS